MNRSLLSRVAMIATAAIAIGAPSALAASHRVSTVSAKHRSAAKKATPAKAPPASVGTTISWNGVGKLQPMMDYDAAKKLLETPASSSKQKATYRYGLTITSGFFMYSYNTYRLSVIAITTDAFQWESTGVAVGSTLAQVQAAGIAGLTCNSASTRCTADDPDTSVGNELQFSLKNGTVSSIALIADPPDQTAEG